MKNNVIFVSVEETRNDIRHDWIGVGYVTSSLLHEGFCDGILAFLWISINLKHNLLRENK